jgi:hypothetical protein
MNKLLVILISVFIASCGGGGDAGGIPSINSFPLGQFNNDDFPALGETKIYNGQVNGVVNNNTYTNGVVSEKITVVNTRQPEITFQGVASIPFQVTTTRTERSVNNNNLNDSSSTFTNYYDKLSYLFLGQRSSSGSIVVAKNVFKYPNVVNSGDSGDRNEVVVYSDISKSTIVGTGKSTWKVDSIENLQNGEIKRAILTTSQFSYANDGVLTTRIIGRSLLTYNINGETSVKRLSTVESDFVGSETKTLTTNWQ